MNSDFKNVKGLYIHVPFCDGKCFYCAFYSRPYIPDLTKRYLKALESELNLYPRLGVETIFFGGGTPSVLSDSELRDLCLITRAHTLPAGLKEWTVEVNPGTVTEDKIKLLLAAGVNRISIGAQSFDNGVLKWLGRRHRAEDVSETARIIRALGCDNYGLDLIACVPGFGPDVWQHTLQAAVALHPKHISVYALTSEEGSRLARVAEEKPQRTGQLFSTPQRSEAATFTTCSRGTLLPRVIASSAHQFNLLSEDEELEALNLAENILAKEGYHRYEISNYAKAGYECLHNLSCWRGEEYIGIGPAASSHVGLERRTNAPDLMAYLEALEHGQRPPHTLDIRSNKLKQMEAVVFGLRMAEGVSEASALPLLNSMNKLRDEGLVQFSSRRWRLTARGLNLADYVGAELLCSTS